MFDLDVESSYLTPYPSSILYFILLSMVGQKHTPDTTNYIKDTYDYIVVGAGSAGSIVASRLAEKECVTVLLLEAGKSPPKVTDLPIVAASFPNTDLDWSFQTVPQKYRGALVNRTITLSAGKTLGGSSTINGLQSIRGNKKDYDNWAAQGASGWSYEDVLPYFTKLEDTVDTEFAYNGYHGVGGPVTMSKPPYDSDLKYAIYEAATEMGYSVGDSNGDRQAGFNDYQATMREGQRCSTAKAYLVPNENKINVDIVANAFVRKIIINDRRAEGVVFDFGGETREVKARREVILSAGAINSPHILMLSGIGPKEQLLKHNIEVIADLPVGLNLQEQWGVVLTFVLGEQILSFNDKQEDDFNIWRYIQTKTGPLASPVAITNMAFFHKDGSEEPGDYPDYQLYWGEGIYPTINNKQRQEAYKKMPFYWCFSEVLHPKARGMVYLNSSDPYDPPLIDPMYFSHAEDIDVIVSGMHKCKEIGESEPLRKIGSKLIGGIYPGCADAVNDDDKYFRCIANSILISCNHQVGTVKMGRVDDPLTVLDPQLRVKTISNLRVVDASVMPSIATGKTLVPTMMIAEKASDMIKENIQCPS